MQNEIAGGDNIAHDSAESGPSGPAIVMPGFSTNILDPSRLPADTYLRDLSDRLAGAQQDAQAINLQTKQQKVRERLGKDPHEEAVKDKRFRDYAAGASATPETDTELAAAWQAVLEAIATGKSDRYELLEMVKSLTPSEARFLIGMAPHRGSSIRLSPFGIDGRNIEPGMLQSLRDKRILVSPIEDLLYGSSGRNIFTIVTTVVFVLILLTLDLTKIPLHGFILDEAISLSVAFKFVGFCALGGLVLTSTMKILIPRLSVRGQRLIASMQPYLSQSDAQKHST